MGDVDKKIRDLIIQKFMGNNRTVVSSYELLEKETPEKPEEDKPSEDSNEIETNDDYIEERVDNKIDINEDYEEEEEEEEVKDETYEYLKDDPLSRDFVFDNTVPAKIAICLYRINSEGDLPLLEFYCKKDNSVYGFPIADLDTIQMKAPEIINEEVPEIIATEEQQNVEVVDSFAPKQPTEEKPTEEQPTEEQPTEEQPTEEQPTEEQPTEEQPVEEKPTEEQPTEEQPTEEQPTEEQPVEEQPTEEQPTEEQSTEEQPVEEKPTEEKPTQEQPTEEKPTEEKPTEEKPTEEQPTEEQPIEEEPVEEQPVVEQPIEEQPTEEQPIEEQPIEEQPTEEQPTEEEPTEEQPTEEQPTEETNEPFIEETDVQPTREEPTADNPIIYKDQQHGGDEKDINELFFEQVSTLFQQTTQLSAEIAKEKYKGFIKLKNNTYVAVFDFTELEFEDQPDTIWGIIDEIVDKNRILDTSVSETTYQTFYENSFMKYLINSKNIAISIPISVYICEDNNGSYDNSNYKDDETRETVKSIINLRVIHNTLGSCFLFTSEPLNFNNLSKIKRFALFANDAIYLLNDNIDISEYKSLEDYEMVCFKENDTEYWSVKRTESFVEL